MKRILLIRFSALGDVAMLAPVVREVAKANPYVEFTVLSRPMCEPLFEGLGENVKFRGADVKHGEYHSLKGLYKLFRELHQEHYDIICDMHDVLRTKVLRKLFRLHGYEVHKINKHRELRKIITAQGDRKQLRQLPTSFENYIEALPLSPPEGGGHNAFVNEGRGAIGIAPFAAHQGKIYPLEKMEEVVKNLNANPNVNIIYLFSAPGKERELMREWAGKYPNVRLAADECKDLREELRLMKTLNVMLTMDSANMHLASLVGTRVISVWGATHPYAGFLGWGQSAEDCIQRDDLPCRPCSIYGNKPCLRGDMACMQIAPSAIAERVISCIAPD
ncbi:MAG: glycosyltransferase family 9 protein [Prevotella sp.]|nr:glycosyltransferase family 9 protein [Prevotella sp.]